MLISLLTHMTNDLLDKNILPKVKDRVVFITEGRNEWGH